MTHAGEQGGSGGYRRAGLVLVALGAMTVSISGQVQAVEPKLGIFFALVFALTNDIGALLALDAGLSAAPKSAVRFWAWLAIFLAAGAGAALNIWHAIAAPVTHSDGKPAVLTELPAAFGVLIGVEPILLVLVLSHLFGLVVTSHHPKRTTSSDHQADTTSRGDHQPTQIVVTTKPPADHQVPPPGSGRSTTRALPSSTTSILRQTTSPRPTTSSAPAKPAGPTGPGRPAGQPAVQNGGRSALHAVGVRRPGWMTDDLLDSAVDAVKAGGANYGRKQLMDDLGVKDWKARDLLKYIGDHNLARKSA